MGLLDFIIKIAVDASKVKEGTQNIKEQFNDLSVHVAKRLGAAFSVYEVVKFTRETAQAALATRNLAEQLGVTSELIEKIARVSARKGLEPEGFEKIIGKLQVLMDQALTDPSTLAKLEKLGLAWSDIAKEGANAGDAFEKIGQHLRSLPTIDNATRALFSETFGKGSFRYAQAAGDIPTTDPRFSQAQRDSLAKAATRENVIESEVKRSFQLIIADIFSDPKSLIAGPFMPFYTFLKDKLGGNKDVGQGREDVRGGGFIPQGALPDQPLNQMGEDEYNWLMGIGSKKRKHHVTLTDAQASIGSFIGGGLGPAANDFPEKSLRLQERTARAVEEIDTKMANSGQY